MGAHVFPWICMVCTVLLVCKASRYKGWIDRLRGPFRQTHAHHRRRGQDVVRVGLRGFIGKNTLLKVLINGEPRDHAHAKSVLEELQKTWHTWPCVRAHSTSSELRQGPQILWEFFFLQCCFKFLGTWCQHCHMFYQHRPVSIRRWEHPGVNEADEELWTSTPHSTPYRTTTKKRNARKQWPWEQNSLTS